LIVEDDEDMRMFINSILEVEYELVIAKNGVQGFEAAIEHDIDLIVSDVLMPEMDGFALCEKLSQDDRTSHIPVILLTAKTGQENVTEGLSSGAVDYLEKPFDKLILQLKINNIIQNRNRIRERFLQKIDISPKEIAVTPRDEAFVEKAMMMVEANLSDPNFHAKEFVQEMGYSKMHLHRKLKKLTGFSAGDFIREMRLKRAAQLVAEKADNMQQIAFMVGFDNPSYFSKCFKKRFGALPTEYQRD
jgi:YesN/AraC family two-component response regulator